MAPLRLSFAIDGRLRTIEVDVAEEDGAKSSANVSTNLQEAPLGDEILEALFDDVEAALVTGDVTQVLQIIGLLKRQNRQDVNEALLCLRRRLQVQAATGAGFF
jgi:hypothetical protein